MCLTGHLHRRATQGRALKRNAISRARSTTGAEGARAVATCADRRHPCRRRARETGDMRDRDERIQRRGRQLANLVIGRLPREFDVTDDADSWPAIGLGLLSRMTTTLGSVLDLQSAQRETDAAILVRSLYEHVVHFAWLAAEPSAARIEQWRRADLVARLKADDETSQRGVPMLRDEVRVLFKALVARMSGADLNLADLAVTADRYWGGRLPGMGAHTNLESFRGWYALLYRYYSGIAHPSVRGLNPVFDKVGRTRRSIRLESEYRGHGPYGMATVVYAMALFVAGRSFGWPSDSEVHSAFDANPD